LPHCIAASEAEFSYRKVYYVWHCAPWKTSTRAHHFRPHACL